MFSPYKVPNWTSRVFSFYTSNIPLNSGAFVDIDPTDTVGVGANESVGFTALRAGSVKLATVAPADTTHFGRELGIAIPGVNLSGPNLAERLLELASSLLTISAGGGVGLFPVHPGDFIATTEYVGYLPGDSSATGYLDVTNVANLGAPVGIFQGRLRLAQGSDAVRARFAFNTIQNGTQVAVFQFA
jgi:hypothetical protein